MVTQKRSLNLDTLDAEDFPPISITVGGIEYFVRKDITGRTLKENDAIYNDPEIGATSGVAALCLYLDGVKPEAFDDVKATSIMAALKFVQEAVAAQMKGADGENPTETAPTE